MEDTPLNPASAWRLDVARRVSKLYASIDAVRAVNVSSSTARGLSDGYSDLDMQVFWDRPPTDVVNVKNGLVNIETGKLDPHRPDFLTPTQLPVVYDPCATCPAIDKFIAEVFPEDAHRIGYEIPAMLATPYTALQRAILLIGGGANGKSRYLALLVAFLLTSGFPFVFDKVGVGFVSGAVCFGAR